MNNHNLFSTRLTRNTDQVKIFIDNIKNIENSLCNKKILLNNTLKTYDLHVFPKKHEHLIKLIVTEATQNFIDVFFKEHGYIVRKSSNINKRYNHIIKNVYRIGITKTHIFVIVFHRHKILTKKHHIY